jgi:hypothetical protein
MGAAVIARQDRPLFRAVYLRRALDKFLPLYPEDVKTAAGRLSGYQQQVAEAESEAFARREMEEFEQEYGSWKSTRPRDYELRRKTRLESIARRRQEARQRANPKEGDADGQWYWEPKRALEAAERLAQSATPDQAACFEPAGSSTALYKARGSIRLAGAGSECKPLMEPNPDNDDTALPRTATQLITVSNLSRCIDVRTGAVAPGNLPAEIPHGCNVRVPVWAEMDWKKLAALLAP